jgi:hypothetical protein
MANKLSTCTVFEQHDSVLVTLWSGIGGKFQINNTMTIKDLKLMISANPILFLAPVERQYLSLTPPYELKDSETLQSYGIRNETRLHLIIKEFIQKIPHEICNQITDLIKANNTQEVTELLNNNQGELNLTGRILGPEELDVLNDALAYNNTITILNLSVNLFQSIIAIQLANFLRNNESVTSLNLSYNAIGPEGAASLVNLLAHNNTINTMNLQYNRFGPEGAIILANALANNNHNITSLDLRFNEFGPDDIAVLQAVAADRPYLTLLL